MKITDVTDTIERFAPKTLAEPWDNPGLMIGSLQSECTGVVTSLDLTFEVVDVLTGNGREVTVGVVFAFLHAGQGSDVLLHEGAERVFVDVTGEEEVKVAHRCKALAVDLAYAVIVGLGQVREFLSGSQWVVAVYGGNE